MDAQIVKWISLKRELEEIKISHELIDKNDFYRAPCPSEVLQSKKVPESFFWVININKNIYQSSHTWGYSWVNKIDSLLKELKEEISINLSCGLPKESLISYFGEINIFFEDFFSKLHFTKELNCWELTSAKFDEDFNRYDLHKYFHNSLQSMYSMLNDKIMSFIIYLESIDYYRDSRTITKKSITGNNKIEWKKQLNQLVDFYLNQIERGLIDTDRRNLAIFLINNFSYKGENLSESTISTYLDPNKEIEKLPKEHKKIDPSDFL